LVALRNLSAPQLSAGPLGGAKRLPYPEKEKVFKSIAVSLLLTMIFLSCKEVTTPSEDNTLKVNRIYSAQTPLISDSSFTIVQGLFQKNKLSLTNYRVVNLFIYFDKTKTVWCYRFCQGLDLFAHEIIWFYFDSSNVYRGLSGDTSAINFSLAPAISMNDAAMTFYSRINSDTLYKDSVDYFRRQGINAELGIYNLNSGISYAKAHYVLTWKLNVANYWKYPEAYIRADSLSIIQYSYFPYGIIN
jgi:hypothetical protein